MHTTLGLLVSLATAAAAGTPASASLLRLLSELAAPPSYPPMLPWGGLDYEGYDTEFGSGPGLQTRSIVQDDMSTRADSSRMFYNANTFNKPVTWINTTSATTFFGMFQYTWAFNQPVDLSSL